ncbi:MAG TPA: hypothetical protein PLD84_06385, partial [Chitinophagales bacterium]|nr:hypothetical protein [Chitinophagales bacterium]
MNILSAQTDLLLNGGFEDINTCTEYNAECGVEGWFYLKEVKAQMLNNEVPSKLLGANSFAIFYNWAGYTGFTPVIGTILPCGLQKGNRYIFKGIISALLNPKLIFKPGICVGERFYVPNRPFSKTMQPDSIIHLTEIPRTNFHSFEYSFVADGTEKYLTFGTFIEEDTVGGKKKLTGTQTVSLTLDNFQLIPENKKETTCPDFLINKEKIYSYNFRHKEMDYSLYGKGDIAINFTKNDSSFITQIKEPPPPPLKPDTLKLGDVFFDFFNPVHEMDFEKMSEMGANTIRIYGLFPSHPQNGSKQPRDHKKFFDLAYNGGDKPIYVFVSYPISNSIFRYKQVKDKPQSGWFVEVAPGEDFVEDDRVELGFKWLGSQNPEMRRASDEKSYL